MQGCWLAGLQPSCHANSALAILMTRWPVIKVMDPIQLSLSLAGIAVRSQRLMIDFLTRRPDLSGLSDPTGIGQAFLDLTAKMIADPMSIAQMQLELWGERCEVVAAHDRAAGRYHQQI